MLVTRVLEPGTVKVDILAGAVPRNPVCRQVGAMRRAAVGRKNMNYVSSLRRRGAILLLALPCSLVGVCYCLPRLVIVVVVVWGLL